MFGRIDKFTARIAELETASEQFDSRIQALISENDEYKKTIAAFHLVKAEYDNEKDKLVKSHASQVSALNEQLTKVKVSVNSRINEEMAKVGTNNNFLMDNVIISPPISKDNVIAKINSLSPEQQREFYKENKTAISQAVLDS